MRKLLFAGAVLAAPLLTWQPARAAVAAPLDHGAAVAPSASLQKAAWVWVGGRRVWHPAIVYGAPAYRPYAYGWGYPRPYWHRYGYYHPYHPAWAYRW